MLTLTVKNCELLELRPTLAWMGESWKRLTNRQVWPALGFVRSTEVSRAWDCYHNGNFLGRHGVTWAKKWEKSNPGKNLELRPTTEVHPHFHALLLVRPSYFTHGYISQEKWAELWRECLRIEYTPIVHIATIKPNQKRLEEANNGQPVSEVDAIAAGAVEVFKYSVKPEDLFGNGKEVDKEWLIELISQLHKVRAVALGGVLKDFMSDSEPDDLIGADDDGDLADYSKWFTWREAAMRYIARD